MLDCRLHLSNGALGPMEMDLFLACLLIALGAMIAYAVDEYFSFTGRLSEWIERGFDRD